MEELVQRLRSEGAALVGFADLTALPPEGRGGLPRAVSIAVPVERGIVADIQSGPTLAYSEEYGRLNALLNDLAPLAAALLQDRGFAAVPLRATDNQAVLADTVLPLPHKTVATRAGLGWIGKCALLVTEAYGSAVRLNSVLTDAPVPTGVPVDDSRCGACEACVTVCPAQALRGGDWRAGAAREELVDAEACRESIRGRWRREDMPNPVCGMCIAACPWTQRYVTSR